MSPHKRPFCETGFSVSTIQCKEAWFRHYHNIAKLLGVNGLNKRARLPSCMYKRIKELYPDPEGPPTKVGFKRARA